MSTGYRECWKCEWIIFARNMLLECFPEKPSWCRNEQVCQGKERVKRFEWIGYCAIYKHTFTFTVAAGMPGLPTASSQSVCRHPVWHGDGSGRRVWRPGKSSQENEEGEDKWEDGHTSPQPGMAIVVDECMSETVWEELHGLAMNFWGFKAVF